MVIIQTDKLIVDKYDSLKDLIPVQIMRRSATIHASELIFYVICQENQIIEINKMSKENTIFYTSVHQLFRYFV